MLSPLIGGGSAVAALCLVLGLRRERQAWTATSWFVFLFGWLSALPSTFAAFTHGRTAATDVQGNPYFVLSARATELTHLCNYALLAMALLFCFRLTELRRRINVPVVAALLLFAVTILTTALNGGSPFTKSRIILGLALVAACGLEPGRGAALGAATCGLTVAIASGWLVVTDPHHATLLCTGLYKCGPLGVFVFGVLTNENGLALVLLASLGFVWLAFSGRVRLVLTVYLVLMMWFSSSRTSAIAALVCGILFLVFDPSYRTSARALRTRPLQWMVLGTGAFISAWLPFRNLSLEAYSDRGSIWQVARIVLHGHYLDGLGDQTWSSLAGVNLIPQVSTYSTHNQVLDVLFISGWVGLAVFAVLVATLLRTNFSVALAVLMPALFGGTLERLWSIGHYESLSFGYIAALLAVSAERPRRPTSQHRDVSHSPLSLRECVAAGGRRRESGSVMAATGGPS